MSETLNLPPIMIEVPALTGPSPAFRRLITFIIGVILATTGMIALAQLWFSDPVSYGEYGSITRAFHQLLLFGFGSAGLCFGAGFVFYSYTRTTPAVSQRRFELWRAEVDPMIDNAFFNMRHRYFNLDQCTADPSGNIFVEIRYNETVIWGTVSRTDDTAHPQFAVGMCLTEPGLTLSSNEIAKLPPINGKVQLPLSWGTTAVLATTAPSARLWSPQSSNFVRPSSS